MGVKSPKLHHLWKIPNEDYQRVKNLIGKFSNIKGCLLKASITILSQIRQSDLSVSINRHSKNITILLILDPFFTMPFIDISILQNLDFKPKKWDNRRYDF